VSGLLPDEAMKSIWLAGLEAARERDFSASVIDRLTIRGRLLATTALTGVVVYA